MAITRIPDTYQLGFAKIKGLSAANTETLAAVLEKVPATGGIKAMISAVSEHIPSLKREDVGDIVRTLYSLYVLRLDDETPLPELVSALITAMQATGKDSLVLSDIEKVEFENKIAKLLNISTVGTASKIEQLKVEYPNTFEDARIVTDIRPVFAQPQDRPVGAAITHALKIVYHESDEHKEFYVVLDADDLQKLRKILLRAETKATSLRALLQTMNLPDLS